MEARHGAHQVAQKSTRVTLPCGSGTIAVPCSGRSAMAFATAAEAPPRRSCRSLNRARPTTSAAEASTTVHIAVSLLRPVVIARVPCGLTPRVVKASHGRPRARCPAARTRGPRRCARVEKTGLPARIVAASGHEARRVPAAPRRARLRRAGRPPCGRERLAPRPPQGLASRDRPHRRGGGQRRLRLGGAGRARTLRARPGGAEDTEPHRARAPAREG